jgi:hypothetical protein
MDYYIWSCIKVIVNAKSIVWHFVISIWIVMDCVDLLPSNCDLWCANQNTLTTRHCSSTYIIIHSGLHWSIIIPYAICNGISIRLVNSFRPVWYITPPCWCHFITSISRHPRRSQKKTEHNWRIGMSHSLIPSPHTHIILTPRTYIITNINMVRPVDLASYLASSRRCQVWVVLMPWNWLSTPT